MCSVGVSLCSDVSRFVCGYCADVFGRGRGSSVRVVLWWRTNVVAFAVICVCM